MASKARFGLLMVSMLSRVISRLPYLKKLNNFFLRRKLLNSFDGAYYLNAYPDIANSGMNPLLHFIEFGRAEGRIPNPEFDAPFYLKEYPDVASSGMNPYEHYIKFGAKEGRFPNAEFDSGFYLKRYPDVAASGMSPLSHFIHYGRAEGRICNELHLLINYTEVIINSGFQQPTSKKECLEIAGKLNFVSDENPKVSIVIPVYGQCHYTLQCLYSIFINRPKVSFEIILIDDCSPDFSQEVLANIDGVRYHRNSNNLGFIKSCNTGANMAKGEFVCFLNNDTFVLPNWLDELIATFENFPGTGLVGSKLLYPNGQLQEAGGILWQDGSGWNFGKGQNPGNPIYNYVREVDYCSGASIMLRAQLFKELGGFDELYLPAYCEDSDLALKIRDLGYRVLYQPFSEVVHFEGITSGTDVKVGVKAYQIENSKKLFKRWKHRLKTHQIAGQNPIKAKDRTARYRVLVLEITTPTPDHDAGSVTDVNLMILLRDMGFQVTFLATDNLLHDLTYSSALQKIGIEVLYRPYIENVDSHLREFGSSYDLVFLFRPHVASLYLKKVQEYCPLAKTLYYPHDLHHLRMMREAHVLGDGALLSESENIKNHELDAIKSVDLAIMVSEQEAELIRAEAPAANVKTFPLVLNIPGTRTTFEDRRDIIFVGGFNHGPNVDAIDYFVSQMMPLLRNKLPGIKINIVGSNPTNRVVDLAGPDVIVQGFVADLKTLLDKSRVSIAPLRYGAGVKGKVGTSLAAGLPVVTTNIGAEGMGLESGKNVMIANTPEDFVDGIYELYSNPELWFKVSQNGIEYAQQKWGDIAAWNNFSLILTALGFEVSGNPKNLRLYQ